MTVLDSARTVEIAKYARAYRLPSYHMGDARRLDALHDLRALPVRGTYLDVGCGRGEMLEEAERLGFTQTCGVEVVPELTGGPVLLARGDNLPFEDGSFDVVTMFDVIEHVLPGDDETICRELARVARAHVLLTANNHPSKLPSGEDLHINIRTYAEWDALFREWFRGSKVIRIGGVRHYVSEGWRVDVCA